MILKNLKKKAKADDDELANAKDKAEESIEKEDDPDDDDGRKVSVLPKWIKFAPTTDEFYPAEFDNVIYDCY